METHHFQLALLMTDKHKQINAYIRNEVIAKNEAEAAKCLKHYYDVWHVSKGTPAITVCNFLK